MALLAIIRKEMKNHKYEASENFSDVHGTKEETDQIEYKISCSVYGCSTKSVSICVICTKSYCYEHLHLDLHNLKNIEIINQLKNYPSA